MEIRAIARPQEVSADQGPIDGTTPLQLASRGSATSTEATAPWHGMEKRGIPRRAAARGERSSRWNGAGRRVARKDIDAALIIGFYVAVAVLVIRVRRFNLAVTALVLTALLAIALVVQATVSERLGGYAALGLTLTVVMVALAVRLGAWVGDDDVDVDGG